MAKKYLDPPIVEIETTLHQLLEDKIQIPQPGAVRDYLSLHPDILGLVTSVCTTTLGRFGMGTQLVLEVYRDPEIVDHYLTLYVRQEQYQDNILDVLEDVRKLYELELARKSGWILVTTDFSPPK
ncbi:MAG: hypothetical protein HY335_09625 [Deinococcus sp.]|nr:hypothetical protein [Deinococcus sp.]